MRVLLILFGFRFAPPSNAYLEAKDLLISEKYFPLKVMVCDQCWLVQTLDYTNAEAFLARIMLIFQAHLQAF